MQLIRNAKHNLIFAVFLFHKDYIGGLHTTLLNLTFISLYPVPPHCFA